MKLPIIRTITDYGEDNNKEDIGKTIALLEHISQARGLKDEELNVIGELLSNLYGSQEVSDMVAEGHTKSQALNIFMKRVMGSVSPN